MLKTFDVLIKIKDAWCKIYDPSYIEDTIINGIQEKLIDMAPLLAILSEKATGKKSELVESLKEEIGIFTCLKKLLQKIFIKKKYIIFFTKRGRQSGAKKSLRSNKIRTFQPHKTEREGIATTNHNSQSRSE